MAALARRAPKRIRTLATIAPSSPLPGSSATSPLPSSSTPPGPAASSPFEIFSRRAKLSQRRRAALDPQTSRLTDYVRENVAGQMVERLLDIKKRYREVVELGSGAGYVVKELSQDLGTEKVILTDGCEEMLRRDEKDAVYDVEVERRVMDEELLSLPAASADCIVSCLALHWVNDLPGTLIQINNALKPDGVFIGALLGGDTLFELRTSLQLAELERHGGLSPRVSPMTTTSSMSSLLSRCGFALPTVDLDEFSVLYPSFFELAADLRAMGESNAVANRKPFLSRDAMIAGAAIYEALHGRDGGVPATFQVVWVIGWKPDPSQPKPAKRGSANRSMKELEGTSEL